MQNRRAWILASAALLVWASSASAQKQAPVPEGGAVQIMMLRQPSVRRELKLTDDEAKKINDFARQQWLKAQKLENASADEQRVRFDEMTRENEQFLTQTLQPNQKKRLDQITLQVAGLLWCSRDEIAATLNLSPDQRAKVKQLQAEARREMQELLSSTSGADKHEKLKELRTTNRRRLFDVLSDEQETKWKEMSGPKFEGELRLDDSK